MSDLSGMTDHHMLTDASKNDSDLLQWEVSHSAGPRKEVEHFITTMPTAPSTAVNSAGDRTNSTTSLKNMHL